MLKQKSFVNDKSSANLGTNTISSALRNIHREKGTATCSSILVFWPGEFHGKELDTNEQLSLSRSRWSRWKENSRDKFMAAWNVLRQGLGVRKEPESLAGKKATSKQLSAHKGWCWWGKITLGGEHHMYIKTQCLIENAHLWSLRLDTCSRSKG